MITVFPENRLSRFLLRIFGHFPLLSRLQDLEKKIDAICLLHTEELAQLRNEVATLSGSAGVEADFDDFYARFEQIARGTREEIKARQGVYLPYAEQAAARTGCRLVADIGSGRGEWLEILTESGFEGYGAELNTIFLADSRSRGFDVAEGDGVAWLEGQPAGRFCMVTGLQVAEHLPFTHLLRLLKAAERTLRPGGSLILEIPNPTNLQVGSCSFYGDPTHQRPVVPSTLDFMMLLAGFSRREQLSLHPPQDQICYPAEGPLAPLADRWNTGLDCAVIGYKGL